MRIKLLLLLLVFSYYSLAQIKSERLHLANEMGKSLQTEVLNKWYPQCLDSVYGGFISTYTYDFKPTGV